MDKKRLIYAAIFVVVSIGLGYLLYRFFWANKAVPTQKPPTAQITPGKALPSAEETGEKITVPTAGKLPTAQTIPTTPTTIQPTASVPYPIKEVADTPVIGAIADRSGITKFYSQTDGKFYRVDSQGNAQALSDEVFYNVENVIWSPTKNESIIEYPDGSNIYYNFDTQKQVSLPKHWENFSFSSLGDKIAAKSIGLSPENRWLTTSDPQGKNITAIEPLGENADKVTVNWSPNQQIIATSMTGDQSLGADRQEVLFIGQHKENFKSIIVEGRGFESQWSPQGNKLLYSVYSARSNFKPELWLVNASGNNIGAERKMLNLNTWSDKCTFADERFIYCAVPTTLKTGAGFAPGLADSTEDQIYKIDITTGVRSTLSLDEFHTIDSLYIGDGGKTLYFTDKNQVGLFSFPL